MFQYSNTLDLLIIGQLQEKQENYKNGGKFISDNDLRKEFTQLKKQEEYQWLNQVSNNVTKTRIKGCLQYLKRFLKDNVNPNLKVKENLLQFYQDNVQIQFSEKHMLKIEGL